jgi:hypothetical protein
MRGASSGAAIEPPSRVSNLRRFTGVGDGIAFLHDLRFCFFWSGETLCMRINDPGTKAPRTFIPIDWKSVVRRSPTRKRRVALSLVERRVAIYPVVPAESGDPYAVSHRSGTALDSFHKLLTPRSMGPGVRRDDASNDLPDGQITGLAVQPSLQKYFRFA